MRPIRILCMLAVALAAVLASLPAEAHGRGRVSVGFVFGAPVWYYPAYHPYPYYYPAPVAAQTEPTVYIERGDGGAAAAERSSQDYWYYCAESKAYHPYVKHCPGGWEKHVPTPPPGE